MTREEYFYWLCNLEGIGVRKIKTLLKHFGTAKEVYYGQSGEFQQIRGISQTEIHTIINNRNLNKIQESYAKLRDNRIYFVTIEDNNYPVKLRNIVDAPYGLYIKGELPIEDKPTLAIVGARNCSLYGRETARAFARELAKAGIQVISGLARGIDSYAHQGALEAGKETFAVLGCGADICYPAENRLLYERIQEKGGLISEYNLGVPPLPAHFPMRNRIISGLSDGILVVEAKNKSGSLITVDMGLEQGKDVYVIPGRITDSLSMGCNNLIKMGGRLVTEPSELLDDFRMNINKNVKDLKKKYKSLEEKEKMVYAILSLDPKHIDEIKVQTELNMTEISESLLSLELKNLVKQTIKNYYVAATD